MKYIVSKDKDVVIFSDNLIHSMVARTLFEEGDVRSAGFVNADLKPYGMSGSLNIGGHPDDEELIAHHFGKLL